MGLIGDLGSNEAVGEGSRGEVPELAVPELDDAAADAPASRATSLHPHRLDIRRGRRIGSPRGGDGRSGIGIGIEIGRTRVGWSEAGVCTASTLQIIRTDREPPTTWAFILYV